MVYIGFAPKEIKTLAKETVIFYLTSFAFGGCAFALLYFIKPQNVLIKNGVYIGTYPIKIALLGGIVGFIITHISFKIVKNKLKRKDIIYKVTIQLFENEETIDAILDTGNMLKDPITRAPVIIVEKSKLYTILPANLLDNIEKIIGGDGDLFNSQVAESKYFNRLKIIPFSSIGKQNGLMLGIKADKVIIQDEEITDAIIGISSQKLSNGYSALFGLDLLERSENNEFIGNIKK